MFPFSKKKKQSSTNEEVEMYQEQERHVDLSLSPTFKVSDMVALSYVLAMYYNDNFNEMPPISRISLKNIITSLKNRFEHIIDQHGELFEIDIYTFYFDYDGLSLVKKISPDIKNHILNTNFNENSSMNAHNLIRLYENVEKELIEILEK